jgi:hypothetical protein
MPKLNKQDPNRTLRVSDEQEGFFIIKERERHVGIGMSARWDEARISITREEIEKLERVTRPK